MNYKRYQIKGKHVDTKRTRVLKIDAFNEDDARSQASQSGLDPIIEITKIPFEQPSERQLEYALSLGIDIPKHATSIDVSALISKHLERDGTPKEGLLKFATDHKLFFSKYIGKTALYNHVFSNLPDIDRVAFFIFSIYRYITDDRHANLDTHIYRKLFYEFAELNVHDERFMKSMNKYSGENLKYFGEFITANGEIHTGGSVTTIAFKTAREFLIDKKIINGNDAFYTKKLKPTIQKEQQSVRTNTVTLKINTPPPSIESAKGCGTSIIMISIIGGLVSLLFESLL